MSLLVTAFEPFAGARTNSSMEVLAGLQAMDWDGEVAFLPFVPVSFDRAWPFVHERLQSVPGNPPGVVLSLGQAEGRARIGLERLALNWIDPRVPDNDGRLPSQGAIDPGAADVLWSPFDWPRLGDSAILERSYSAGTYVCNALFYRLLTWGRANAVRCGFVHVPLLQSQNDITFALHLARLRTEDAVEAVARVMRFAMET